MAQAEMWRELRNIGLTICDTDTNRDRKCELWNEMCLIPVSDVGGAGSMSVGSASSDQLNFFDPALVGMQSYITHRLGGNEGGPNTEIAHV